MTSPLKEFCTDDIALATFLHTEGYRHTQMRMKDRRFAEWVFAGNGDLTTLVAEYQRSEAAVEPLAFTTMLHEIRSELYRFLRKHKKAPINVKY
jgi:hypothetical protein